MLAETREAKESLMGLGRSAWIMLALAMGGCGAKGKAAEITALDVEAVDGKALARVTVRFDAVPPQAGDGPMLTVGSGTFLGVQARTFTWAELAEMDSDPATTAGAGPKPKSTQTFAVPLPLNPAFETKNVGRDMALIANLMWGRDENGAIPQARAETSVAELYKKQVLAPPRRNEAETDSH